MDSLRKLAEGFSSVFSSGNNDYKTRKSIIEGYLTKRALKSGVNWDKRYFMLYPDGELAYFLTIDSEGPRGVMKLNSEFFVSDHPSMELGFLVSDMATTYYLRADSMEEKMYWMHTVARVLRQLSADAGTPMDTTPIMTPEIDKEIGVYAAARPASVRVASLARVSLLPREGGSEPEAEPEAEPVPVPVPATVPVPVPEAETETEKGKAHNSETKREYESGCVVASESKPELAGQEPEPIIESAPAHAEDQTIKLPPVPPQSTPETTAAPASGGIGNLTKMWQNKANAHTDIQARNPFRDGGRAGAEGAPRPGDPEYGRAVTGSQTAERAAKAQDWVEQEIAKLISVIRDIGQTGPEGQVSVKFGPLFYTYQDISDTLVGIMMRAKKRKLISYPGDMLFQGVHNDVEIFVVVESVK